MSITKSSHYSSPGTYQLTLNLISLRMRSEAASLHLCVSFMAKGALLLSLPRHQETSMVPGMTLMFDINYSNLFLRALGKFRQKTNGMKKHGNINNTLIGLGSHGLSHQVRKFKSPPKLFTVLDLTWCETDLTQNCLKCPFPQWSLGQGYFWVHFRWHVNPNLYQIQKCLLI